METINATQKNFQAIIFPEKYYPTSSSIEYVTNDHIWCSFCFTSARKRYIFVIASYALVCYTHYIVYAQLNRFAGGNFPKTIQRVFCLFPVAFEHSKCAQHISCSWVLYFGIFFIHKRQEDFPHEKWFHNYYKFCHYRREYVLLQTDVSCKSVRISASI